MAFSQVNIEHDMFKSLPVEIVPTDSLKDYILLLKKRQKQASRVFYLYLKEGLMKIGFQPSKIDE